MTKLPDWAPRAAQAIVSADAVILAALVHENVISSLLATDIGGVIAALAIGWHASAITTAAKAKSATTNSAIIAPSSTGV